MKASDLRAIANRQPSDRRPSAMSASNSSGSGRRRIGDYLYYGLLGSCGLMVLGMVGLVLEDPASRDARLLEQAKQEQVRAVERQRAEIDDAKQAKDDAKQARLDACTGVEYQAFAASQNAVRAKLKAPSTASFPWTPIRAQHTGDCKFQVLAYVDAQNGFGAMIRSNYIATLRYDPDTKGWRVTSAVLEN